jgi:catechol 2,3-dioxygenase-like lactoylglutathione lyase family enzyme
VLSTYDVIGFIPVRDLDRAEEFYGGQLGLKVLGKDGFALVLRSGTAGGRAGNMIRCVLMPESKPARFTVLGWEVPDIAVAAAELKAAGVEAKHYSLFPQDEHGVWTAPNGDKVLWFEDPDGNVLSLSQHTGGAE